MLKNFPDGNYPVGKIYIILLLNLFNMEVSYITKMLTLN